jgi:hypothetical protein
MPKIRANIMRLAGSVPASVADGLGAYVDDVPGPLRSPSIRAVHVRAVVDRIGDLGTPDLTVNGG